MMPIILTGIILMIARRIFAGWELKRIADRVRVDGGGVLTQRNGRVE
jgi:hypothetical protein